MKNINRKLIFTMILTFIIALTYGSVMAGASSQKEKAAHKYKYYSSIQLQPGTSLWSLASEYADQDIISHDDYMKELKKINCLSSDTIHAGQHLTFFYYSEELK